MSRMDVCVIAALGALGSACAHQPRFLDRPVVWQVDDRRDIPEPDEEEYLKLQYFADVFALRRLERQMEIRDREPARNTNALDEAPDSSWFENRIGRRPVSPAEAARGLDKGGPPKLPIVIKSGKVGGGNAGFVAKDATGRRFIVKFDKIDNPGMQTSASVIVNRIFWTSGYFVPSDHVFVFDPADLSIDRAATVTNWKGDKEPFTPRMLEEILATAPRRPDGSYRAVASQYLDGKPKGGCLAEGVRGDDPNDLVPHEHRRELRGLRVFSAWTGHTDIKQDNFLDMYVEEGGRRFLRHHLIDFGEALGGHQAEKDRDEDGYEHYWDWENQAKAFAALGLWRRPWEDRIETRWPSIGAFASADFDPTRWREAYPFFPFMEMDESDAYWAAKIIMRFDRPVLAAIVKEGQLGQADAEAYLVDTLIGRQRKIGMAYLETVTPLDDWEIGPGKLCATDLGMRYGLARAGMVERLDDAGEVVQIEAVAEDGRVCVGVPDSDEYTVYRLRTRRGRERRPVLQVHLKGGPRARILGVIRWEK